VKNRNKIRATVLSQMWKGKKLYKNAKGGKYKLYIELLKFIETISPFECCHFPFTFSCPVVSCIVLTE